MTDRKSVTHNAITSEYIQRIGRSCDTPEDVMVITESMLVGALLLVVAMGASPAVAAEWGEVTMETALERFTMVMAGKA